jgi:hypothetical protein
LRRLTDFSPPDVSIDAMPSFAARKFRSGAVRFCGHPAVFRELSRFLDVYTAPEERRSG